MDLSVICPVYNNVETMLPMLASFQLQDIGEYSVEYLFICNGCTDNSEEVLTQLVKLFPATFKNYKIVHADKGDVGIARQIGVNISTGNYILFCDMDDWLLSKTMFRELLEIAYSHPDGTFQFGIDLPKKDYFFTENNQIKYATYWRLKNKMTCTVWRYLFPRRVFDTVSFPANKNGEDDVVITGALQELVESGKEKLYIIHKDYYFWNYLDPHSQSYKVMITKNLISKEEFLSQLNDIDPATRPTDLNEVIMNLL